jgi:trehalose-6-phosphate synthase
MSSQKAKFESKESFDTLVNQLLGTYVFEANQFDEDDENDVTDQEVSKEVNEIKKQKDKQKASVNPAEVKKIMQGAKKIGVPIGGQQQ